jgi:hypothetical protein
MFCCTGASHLPANSGYTPQISLLHSVPMQGADRPCTIAHHQAAHKVCSINEQQACVLTQDKAEGTKESRGSTLSVSGVNLKCANVALC